MQENNLKNIIGFFISFMIDIIVLILGYLYIPKKFKLSMLIDNQNECILSVVLIAVHILLLFVMIKLFVDYIRNSGYFEISSDNIKVLIAKIVVIVIDLILTMLILQKILAFVLGFGMVLFIVYCVLTSS